jgi:hypothetical protein
MAPYTGENLMASCWSLAPRVRHPPARELTYRGDISYSTRYGRCLLRWPGRSWKCSRRRGKICQVLATSVIHTIDIVKALSYWLVEYYEFYTKGWRNIYIIKILCNIPYMHILPVLNLLLSLLHFRVRSSSCFALMMASFLMYIYVK